MGMGTGVVYMFCCLEEILLRLESGTTDLEYISYTEYFTPLYCPERSPS